MSIPFTPPAIRHYSVSPCDAFPCVAMTGAAGLGVSLAGSSPVDFPASSVFCYGDFRGG